MTTPDPQRILNRLQARSVACRRHHVETEADRIIAAQDAMETGSQEVGADDEYA